MLTGEYPPKIPIFMFFIITTVITILLFSGMHFASLSSMVDFLAVISPVLFTAFGIWIGVLDPSRLFSRLRAPDDNKSGRIVYNLCHILIYSTYVLIITIILKALFLSYPSWSRIFILIDSNYVVIIKILLKFFTTYVIIMLYLIEIWVAFGVISPMDGVMDQHENKEFDVKISSTAHKLK